jgi:hypothetical protein
MKDFAIRFYEDHGLWNAEALGASVCGFTSALLALEAWKSKVVDLTLTDAIIKHELDFTSHLDAADLDKLRGEIDSLKLALESEKRKNEGLIGAIKKLREPKSEPEVENAN